MKKIDEIKVDLVNSKWLSFNEIDLENDPLVKALSKALKKDETVYSIVSGIILLEDKKLAKESDKLARLQEKQAKSEKPLSEAMQKTMDEVADELANPKRAGKAMMAMTDKRVITVYEDLNKDYKIKAFKRNVEDIMGIDASRDASQPNLFNFVVSFGKVVVRMVTTNEQNIKHFEFALDQQIAMEAENHIVKEDEKIVDKEAKKIVKAEKVEAKEEKKPAKKAVAKKPAAKKAPTKKKAPAKKTVKPAAKKADKKPAVKKPVKKSAPKKAVAKKPAAKKPAAKKATKPVAKKSAPKASKKTIDAVVIGDEDNKSFKKQEKEISKEQKKQEKETKKDAKKAFKPAKTKKAKPAKKQKPAKAAKAPKVKKEKAAKPAKAKKASKLSFKSIFDLSHIWMIIIALLAMGIVAASAIMYATNWQNKYWIPASACEIGFAGLAIILGVITLIPEMLKNKFSYAKGMGLVLFVFILVIGIVSVTKTNYLAMETFEYIITVVSSWLIFDNLYNGVKGLIKPNKKRA